MNRALDRLMEATASGVSDFFANTGRPDACQLARAGRKEAQRFLAEPAAVTAFGELAPTYRPAVRFAPMMATPGEARAFTQVYTDHPRWIGPDSASYRAGFAFAEKHAAVDRDCNRDRDEERFNDGSGR